MKQSRKVSLALPANCGPRSSICRSSACVGDNDDDDDVLATGWLGNATTAGDRSGLGPEPSKTPLPSDTTLSSSAGAWTLMITARKGSAPAARCAAKAWKVTPSGRSSPRSMSSKMNLTHVDENRGRREWRR